MTCFVNALSAIFRMWTEAIANKIKSGVVSGRAADLDPGGASTLVVAVCSGAMSIAKAEQTASNDDDA